MCVCVFDCVCVWVCAFVRVGVRVFAYVGLCIWECGRRVGCELINQSSTTLVNIADPLTVLGAFVRMAREGLAEDF